MNNDINRIKEMKRDFIDAMIGYGVQYETCGKISAALNAAIESLAAATAPPVLAAPANSAVLPEPVAHLRFRAAQQWSGSGNHDVEYNEWLETCFEHEVGDDKVSAFAAYTTDQLRAYGQACAAAERAAILNLVLTKAYNSAYNDDSKAEGAYHNVAAAIRART